VTSAGCTRSSVWKNSSDCSSASGVGGAKPACHMTFWVRATKLHGASTCSGLTKPPPRTCV
jgi:hypothetical protein